MKSQGTVYAQGSGVLESEEREHLQTGELTVTMSNVESSAVDKSGGKGEEELEQDTRCLNVINAAFSCVVGNIFVSLAQSKSCCIL